ncbi:MAG: COX15/CtaA family protein, partial [Pseudomonadales bacterium]|nr:COX15/CtaA family protein [Pseudomonadales bacterium]
IGMLVIQVSLGISTLVLHVPVPVAVSHQGGALLLLTAAIWMVCKLGSSAENSA